MKPSEKYEIMTRLMEDTANLEKFAQSIGDIYFSLTVSTDRISIRVYDEEINKRFMTATWNDPVKDPEWAEVADSKGWVVDFTEDDGE